MNKARMTIRLDQEQPPETVQAFPDGTLKKGQYGAQGSIIPSERLYQVPQQVPELQDTDVVNAGWTPSVGEPAGEPAGEIVGGLHSIEETVYYMEPGMSRSPDSHGPLIEIGHPVEVKGDSIHGTDLTPYNYYRTHRPSSFWKMAGVVSAAVATGLLFGYAALSMINGSKDKAVELEASSEAVQTVERTTAPGNAAAAVNPGSAASILVSTQEQKYYVLQYGVFSSAEGAEQAIMELEQSGVAAAEDGDQENRVYAGISPDREQAKLLSSQLGSQGMELYVREVTLPAIQSAVFAGDAGTVAGFFETGSQLAAELSGWSASVLMQSAPAAGDSGFMEKISDLHLKWTEASRQLAEGIGPELQQTLAGMQQNMNSSVTALSEFNKNKSKGHLWEIQTGMMNYIVGQKKLLAALQGL